MFVVRLIGGLGNQMFQYAFARALARRRGLPVKLDASWYAKSDFGSDAPRQFMLEKFNIAGELATAEELRDARRPSRLAVLAQKALRKLIGANYGYDPRAFYARDGSYLEGFWQSERYFADMADEIRREFSLKAPLSQAAAAILKQIESADAAHVQGTEAEASVSIHVRRGDFVTNKAVRSAFGTVDLAYYRAASRIVTRRVAAPRCFVFSDDIAWAKENLKYGGPAVYVSRPGISDVEELILMSRCRHHILANSSFSWWGAWLDPRPDKIVVAPRRWFRDWRFRTSGIVPEGWVRC